MTVELATLISISALVVSVLVASFNTKRLRRLDNTSDATQMTTVIVKLENIGKGIDEIKAEMNTLRCDVKEVRERVIINEQNTKQAHRRIDEIKGGNS